MYFDAARDAQAEAYFRKIIELGKPDPAFLEPYTCLRLGNLMDLQNRRAEARRFYDRAAERAGNDAGVKSTAEFYSKQAFER